MTHRNIAIGMTALFACAGSASTGTGSAPTPGTRVAFIACPMIRDTYIPAWLAQNGEDLYYLGPQGDLGAPFQAPELNHKALIEGVVAEGDRISGGIVLSPVKASVLPEIDESCNTILPANGFADPPHHRTPGPSNTVVGPRPPRPSPPPPPQPPYQSRQFDVIYSFDIGDRTYSRNNAAVSQAAQYAKAINAKSVEVTGFRSGALLSDGSRVLEREGIGNSRAKMVAGMLEHAGIDPAIVTIRVADAEFGGKDDYRTRRAAIIVKP